MPQFGSALVSSPRQGPPDATSHVEARVVVMRGEYDITTVASLWKWFGQVMAADDADLIVDMGEVTFLDAATISVVIRARTFLAERSRWLLIRSPSPCVRRIFEICELDTLFEVTAG